MSQVFDKEQKTLLGLLGWFVYFCLSILLHLLVVTLLILARRVKAVRDETKIAWVTVPRVAVCGSSGGSTSIGDQENVERQRRVSESATNSAMRVGIKSPRRSSTTVSSAHQGVNGGKPNPKFSTNGSAGHELKGAGIVSKVIVGTAGVGSGGGVGVGTSVQGLRAYSGANGATGLISELDGNFPFIWYLQQIQARVTGNWGRASITQGRVQVYFRIMRSGAVDGVRVEIPSGSASFDKTALLAVLRSAPLPKLPDGFDADSLGVRFWFTYLGN